MLVQLGIQPVDDPLREIEMLAGEMKAFKEAVGEKVNALASLVTRMPRAPSSSGLRSSSTSGPWIVTSASSSTWPGSA